MIQMGLSLQPASVSMLHHVPTDLLTPSSLLVTFGLLLGNWSFIVYYATSTSAQIATTQVILSSNVVEGDASAAKNIL
jgi:hypothetical protein